MALCYVDAGHGWEERVCCGQQWVNDCQGSGLAESQPLYVSALNVNGLPLATRTARLGNSR